ncbi:MULTISPECIES: hypothetical protein [Serratia]|uniref:hypothetical protein n=1 Tax=Serratia TaxID=613 RepID=UPI000744F327|nr:hypothetical protein [Serratia marcescens]CUZ74044.1 Uncharacterised protein [Serratia marcescens]
MNRQLVVVAMLVFAPLAQADTHAQRESFIKFYIDDLLCHSDKNYNTPRDELVKEIRTQLNANTDIADIDTVRGYRPEFTVAESFKEADVTGGEESCTKFVESKFDQQYAIQSAKYPITGHMARVLGKRL